METVDKRSISEENVGTQETHKPDADMERNSKETFCRKLLWTCVVFYAHACMALMIGAIGPAFLDLLHLLNTTVEVGSVIFTSQAVGGMVGGLASAWVYTKFRKEVVLTVALLFSAGFNVLFPFCPYLWLMCLIAALRALAIYLTFTGCALICIETWRQRDGSPILQALHCAYSAGGVIAPFIMSEFLQEQRENDATEAETNKASRNFSSTWNQNNATQSEIPGSSKVHWGFLIIGMITVGNFVFSLAMVWIGGRQRPLDKHVQEESREVTQYVVKETEEGMHRLLTVTFLSLIVVYFMMIVAMETLMQNYLATFVIRYLDWSKAEGSRITSAFWGAFAAGRMGGILTAKFLTPWKIITIDFALLSAATLTLVFAVDSHYLVLWICVSGSGIFVSGLYAAGCSFVDDDIINITGKIYSVFLVSETAGSMIYPPILGTLIDNYSPFWFIYLALIISVICDVDFVILTVMVKKWGKKARQLKFST